MTLVNLVTTAKWPALTAFSTFALVFMLTGSFPNSAGDALQRIGSSSEENIPSVISHPSVQDETNVRWSSKREIGDIEWQSPPLPRSVDKDCGDFRTRREAQRFFSAAGRGDPHRLDGDRDGQACETLR